jgi:hypothetical protein
MEGHTRRIDSEIDRLVTSVSTPDHLVGVRLQRRQCWAGVDVESETAANVNGSTSVDHSRRAGSRTSSHELG